MTSQTLHGIIKLTRWREFYLFTSILTLLGGLVAYQVRDAQLDWKLMAVLLANLAAMAYAFMINDIEDAEDDAHEADRGDRNPITRGELSKSTGWIAAFVMAGISLFLYWLGGTETFLIGVLIVVLAHLYSWKPIRLKSLPVVDILSHANFLSMLLFLAALFIYSTDVGVLWILAIGTFLVSAYGQLYNQVRDYEADQAAGLNNTASVLGKEITNILAYGSIIGFVLSIIISTVLEVFPLWLLGVLIVSAPIVLYLNKDNKTDARGSETDDPMAQVQEQFLIIFNIVLFAWFIAIVVGV